MLASTLRALRVLTEPVRLRVLLLLERDELSVAELQDILSMGQSKISGHLAQLKQAGLVDARRAGKNIFYRSRVDSGAAADGLADVLPPLRKSAAGMAEAQRDRAALELVLRRRQDKVRAYFDELAGRFGREYVPGRSWQAVAEMLLKLMPPMVIGDLGAGEGTLSLLLARRAKRVIAVDSSERMVRYGSEVARSRAVGNLEYRLGDLESLPVEDAALDLAIFSQSLHHAQHPGRAAAEAYRTLKPGGRVAVLDLKRHAFEQAHELYADVWLGFTELDLSEYLSAAGFADVELMSVSREPEPPHFETLLATAIKPA
jgi:ArsR family transcriptional regulator